MLHQIPDQPEGRGGSTLRADGEYEDGGRSGEEGTRKIISARSTGLIEVHVDRACCIL